MKKKNKKKIKYNAFKVIFKYAKPFKKQLILLVILLLVTNLMSVFTGYTIGQGTELVTKNNFKLALVFFLLYVFVETTCYVGSRIVICFLNKYQIKICRKIGYDTYVKTLSLPAYAFEKMSSGEIINRVTKDTEKVLGLVQSTIHFITRVLGAIIVFIYILFHSWIIALEIFIFVVAYIYPLKYFRKKTKEASKVVNKEYDKYTQVTVESVRGIREIKTLGLKNKLYNMLNESSEKVVDATLKQNTINAAFDVTDMLFSFAMEGSVFITSAFLVYKGVVPLAFFMSMTYYVYRFSNLLDGSAYFFKNLEEVSVALDRVGEILNNKLFKDVSFGVRELNNPEGIIRFKDVTFHYPKESDVLKDFNVEFRPNMKIAIVGSSGGGKTTIFNLLTRLFEPIKGKITLDGVNISSLTESSLRNNISIIRQDPFIFNKTILENFLIIDDSLSLDEIRHYCKLASIDDYIMSLPKKYNTLLGEGGVNLSGGQKQRLAIARTLVKKSKVILFDEATSALDNETQDIVKDTISNLVTDHTIIIIAHRLETIIDSDIIYVIDNGKVLDSGTHKQLLKRCPYYKKLYHERESKNIIQ